jgi:CheY-like chemotaxis protein
VATVSKPVRQSELLNAILTALEPPRLKGAAPLPASGTKRAKGQRRLRLLLAEDNPVNQRLAVRLLEKRGHEVTVAANGNEALEALRRSAFRGFDLVLMDVQMPVRGGLETTVAIRKEEQAESTRVPIVAMTAHAMPGDRERCLAVGMDGYLAKPIRPEELFDAVERLAVRARPAPPRKAKGDDTAALDEAALLAQVQDDLKLAVEIIGLSLADAPKSLARLAKAMKAGDLPAASRAAHALKGSLSYLGAGPARKAALALETAAAKGDAAFAESALSELQREVGRLLPELRALRARLKASRGRGRRKS